MNEDYQNKVPAFLRDTREKFFSNMENVMKTYERDIKEVLDTPPARTGRVYRNVKGKDVHVAAAPDPGVFRALGSATIRAMGLWEPPAPLSYELIRSIGSTVTEKTETHWTGYIYSNAPYVAALEMGRGGLTPMAPRPAWYRTFHENLEDYAGIALQGFKRR